MNIQEQPTVADIAVSSLAAVRVFERFGIDYCCGGKRPLEEVCQEMGLSSDAVRAELDQAMAARVEGKTGWNTAPLSELIRHIIGKHHEYLKLEMPRLNERLQKVMKVYGERDPATLSELPAIYGGLWDELDRHMHKEELMLFPVIERYEAAVNAGAPLPPAPFGTVANPIRVMEMEHQSAGNALKRMRELTKDYHLPDYACVTYRSLLEGLKELEADLHVHIHLENNILFPRAIELERKKR